MMNLSFVSDDFNLDVKSAASIMLTIRSNPYIAHIWLVSSVSKYSEKIIIIEATVKTVIVTFFIKVLL